MKFCEEAQAPNKAANAEKYNAIFIVIILIPFLYDKFIDYWFIYF